MLSVLCLFAVQQNIYESDHLNIFFLLFCCQSFTHMSSNSNLCKTLSVVKSCLCDRCVSMSKLSKENFMLTKKIQTDLI